MSILRALVDFGGSANAGVPVSVFIEGTQTLAPLVDKDGNPSANPTTVLANGQVLFYGDVGRYTVTGAGMTKTVELADQPVVGGGGTGGPETDPVAGPRITAETSARTAADTTEVNRAQGAESTLTGEITTETGRAEAAESAETSRAEGAESSETSRAEAAESARATNQALSDEASRAQSAESSEATRAQAAESANTTSITNHVNSATAHASDNITFNDTGLIVVKGANVKAALAAVDTWINARPVLNPPGPLANLPANGSQPNGSTYFATDQFGGTQYEMVAGVWVQSAAGVTQASGQMIAGPVPLTTSFDVKAAGAVATDVTGMSLNVPASTRPVLLKAKFELQANSGTAAAASVLRIQVLLTDNTNAVLDAGTATYVQVTAVAVIFAGQIMLERYLPAPVAAGTYKIRAMLLAAAPANWTSAFLLPSNGSSPTAADNFYAVTC